MSFTKRLRANSILIAILCFGFVANSSRLCNAQLRSGQVANRQEPGFPRVFPTDRWDKASAADVNLDSSFLLKARDYALTGGGAGMITRHGRLVLQWGDVTRKFDVKSTSKSIGVTALGLAMDDGKIRLNDLAKHHHSQFGTNVNNAQQEAWLDAVTIEHLATQTAGFEKPGGYHPILFRPGSRWHYSDGGPNWLAECVTLAMGQDIQSLMRDRVLKPIGVRDSDLHWRNHAYRDRKIGELRRYEFGSGVHANVNALARIGLLYLNEGQWRDRRLLSKRFVDLARQPRPSVLGLPEQDNQHGDASEHYGLLWWNNHDGALKNVPRDAYWSWGLHESFIVVIPSLDIVVSRAGSDWKRTANGSHYDVIAPFLQPICAAAKSSSDKSSSGESSSDHDGRAPYPPSEQFKSIQWQPADAIVRLARGSDNWPIASMGDGSHFTAYGDGFGFQPKLKQKLSLGFARVTGAPGSLKGVNLRSQTGEQIGDGKRGKKASGLTQIDGTLYMWARNAGNSQLAWSSNEGITWTWADWKMETSFGCPTFIQYGDSVSAGNDSVGNDYAYIVSQDSASAYQPADRMVLARVKKSAIRKRGAYEFFVRVDNTGKPVWSSGVDDRGAAFSHKGRCYRSGLTYNSGLQRYLWCQVLPDSPHPQGPRFAGGFGIYEATNPWGPWSTIYFTESWDVGPGESSRIPPNWISEDGKTIHLLFSGDDAFSVRQGTLIER